MGAEVVRRRHTVARVNMHSSDPPSFQTSLPVPIAAIGGDGAGRPMPSWEPVELVETDTPRDLPVRASAPSQLPVPVTASPPPLFPDPPSPTETRWAMYDWLDLLKRGRKLILLTTVVAVVLALGIWILKPKTYEASALLLINAQQPILDATAEFAAVPGLEERKLLNQALILQQSPEIAERTARRLLESGTPPALAVALDDPSDVDELARVLQEEVVRVSPVGDEVDGIEISIRARTPEEAVRIADIYTEEYITRSHETSRMALVNAHAFLSDNLAERQNELEEIESEIRTFETGTGSIDLPLQASARISQVAQLEMSLDQARVERQMRASALRAVENELASIQPHIRTRLSSGTEQELQRLDVRIAEVETSVETIYQRNPELRGNVPPGSQLADMERQLADLQAERNRLAEVLTAEIMSAGGVDVTNPQSGGTYITELNRRVMEERTALAGADAEISSLSQRLGVAQGALSTVPEYAMRLTQLRRQQESAERMVLYLEERAEQTRIALETDFGLAQVLRPAQLPKNVAGLSLPVTGIISLILGLSVGLVLATGRHRLDSKIYAPRDLHSRGLPVLSVIPPIEGDAIVALTNPLAQTAESYRHLLARLRRGPGGPRPQAVVVSSAEKDAKASNVAANLAIVAAQGGLRTLLVDADLRHPSIENALGLSDEVGAGQNHSPLSYWTTDSPNLFALTPREVAIHPEALWSAVNVRELLMRVRSGFDLIVFDTPPTLLSADASVIASQTDAVLLVARAAETQGDALLQAASELHDTGGELIGAVLTEFHPGLAHGYDQTYGYRQASHNHA